MVEYEQNIQESILQSIDYLIKDRVSNLALDQTIICTVVECTNTLTGEYRVQYQDGFFLAYSQDQTGYIKKDLVYVLIPLGDFSNKKIITGKATTTSDRELLSLLEIDKYNYKQTSGNCLSAGKCHFPQGLNSYKVLDGRYLYYKIEEHELADSFLIDTISQFPQIDFDEDGFKSSLAESKYIKLAADFRTNLSYAHKLSQYGKYGLAATFAFKNNNAQIQTRQINEDVVEYYNKEDIYYQTYTLDSDQMIGNPYRFQNQSSQYIVYNIDSTNLLYLKSIQIYSKDFEKTTVIGSDEDDIFISNIQLYTADDATKSDNNYNLIISPLDGTSFSKKDQSLRLKATVIHQGQTDVTLGNQLNYYWFLKDDKINSGSDEYSYLAGARWRKLSLNNSEIVLNEKNNLAYQNEYKLIVTITNSTQDNSPQFILSETIKIFNLTRNYPISLTSNKGLKFDFKSGITKITCLIDQHDGIHDQFISEINNEDFSFWWSKTVITPFGEKTTTYLKTREELEQELEQALLMEKEALENNELVDSFLSQSLRNELENFNNVEINKNIFNIDTFDIEDRVEIGCTVYQKINNKDYYLGATNIILTNGEEKVQRGYSIEILNGSQTFQYDEDGISPASDKYQVPQIIYPLEIKFYSPNGELVDANTYNYSWIIPIKNTMLNFELNYEDYLGNEEFKIYYEDVLPIQIANEYNNTTTNNQVKVQLEYNNEIFYETSNFTFLKIGENGTNGTQYVGKIVSKREPLNNSLLSVITNNGINARWNIENNFKLSDREVWDILQFEKYYNGQQVNILSTDNISWEISGVNARFLSFNTSNTLEFKDKVLNREQDDNTKYLINQIIKATLSYLDENGNVRYLHAFLGIPYINYLADVNYNIFFDKNKTLREVVYDNDGTNPSYNSNLGFSFSWDYDGEDTKYLVIKPMGGYNEEPDSASFELLMNKYDKAQSFVDTSTWSYEYSNWSNTAPGMIIPISKDQNSFNCYISPKKYYDGEYTNQCVAGRIYNSEEIARQELFLSWGNIEENPNYEAQFYMPIKFSLNVYGYGFLNNWDGNNIKIDNDEGYILAPQIGAGQKNEDNTFTGIVMGQERVYHRSGETDKQIGLLGYSKGRRSIFLDAKTGRAEFGRERTKIDKDNGVQCGRIILDPEGISSIGSWIIGNNSLYNITNKKGQSSNKLGPGYEDINFTNNHIEDIGHEDSGILISADPAYISVKGSKATVKGVQAEEEEIPDSLELQIDPNQASLFSIFGHYKTDNGWERKLKVGIDANGRFFANSLQNNYSNLNVSAVDAFGSTTNYIGMVNEVNFGEEIDSENKVTVFKAFIPKGEVNTVAPLYISGGNLENEYARPMYLYGKEFKVFTNNAGTATNDPRRNLKEAENSLIISEDLFELSYKKLLFETTESNEDESLIVNNIGYKDNDNVFPIRDEQEVIGGKIFRGFSIKRDGDFDLISDNNFNFYGKDFSFVNSDTLTFTKPLILYVNGRKIELGSEASTVTSPRNQTNVSNDGKTIMDLGYSPEEPDRGFWISSKKDDDTIGIDLRHGDESSLNVGNGFYLDTGDGAFNVDSSKGFEISTDNSKFNMDSEGGFSLDSFNGDSSTQINGKGIEIENGRLIAEYAEFTGKKKGTNNSIEASYNIEAADFTFISDPILQSNKQNTELGKGMTVNSSKSLTQQLNEIYAWSKVVSQWYKEFQDFKNDFENNFKKQYSKDITTINGKISTMGADLAKTMGQLGSEVDPIERYGTINEEVQTQHKIISSKEFYAGDFIRDNDTVYFIVDD